VALGHIPDTCRQVKPTPWKMPPKYLPFLLPQCLLRCNLNIFVGCETEFAAAAAMPICPYRDPRTEEKARKEKEEDKEKEWQRKEEEEKERPRREENEKENKGKKTLDSAHGGGEDDEMVTLSQRRRYMRLLARVMKTIAQPLSVDPSNSEALYSLPSVRLSQQQPDDAKQRLVQSQVQET
jgi:hypothetical protein